MRPADVIGNAVMVAPIATGEIEDKIDKKPAGPDLERPELKLVRKN